MNTRLYVRVSTTEQFIEGFSINAQLEKLKAFCVSQDWTIIETYIEEGRSAKDIDRPQLRQLLSDMQPNETVLVYKLDRLSRSVGDINYLLNLFEDNKVSFKSSTEPYDTTTSQGKLLINIFASLAQFEREQLAERTVMGMMRKHEEGGRNGGRAPFGYQLKDGKLIIDETEAKTVQWIFEKFKTKGKKLIAQELNQKEIRSRTGTLWNGSMVSYIVINPVYTGYLRWNYRTKAGNRTYEEILVKSEHESIVTKEVFDEVKVKRKERKDKSIRTHTIYPFSGVAKCARCGHKLNGEKRKRVNDEYRFYKCSGRFVYGTCDLPIVNENELEKEFINALEYVAVDVDLPQQETIDKEDIQRQLKSIKSRKGRLKEIYVDGDLSKKEYRDKLDNENEKEVALMSQLETSEQLFDPNNIKELIRNFKLNFHDIALIEKKEIISVLFESLTVDVKNIHQGGTNKKSDIEIIDVQMKQL